MSVEYLDIKKMKIYRINHLIAMYGPIQEEYHVLPYAENSYTKAQQKVLTKHKTVVVPSTRYAPRYAFYILCVSGLRHSHNPQLKKMGTEQRVLF
jgi:hypothetical protein